MNIKKKLILLSSCLMLTGFALVRNVTKEVKAAGEEPKWELVEDIATLNSNEKVIMVSAYQKEKNGKILNIAINTTVGSNKHLGYTEITYDESSKSISNVSNNILQMKVNKNSSQISFQILNLNNYENKFLSSLKSGFNFDDNEIFWKYSKYTVPSGKYPQYNTFNFTNNNYSITFNGNNAFFGCYNSIQQFHNSYGSIALFKLNEETKDPVESFTVSSNDVTLTMGETETITPEILPETADQGVTWHSEQESIASVSGGIITAKGVGSTKIIATTVGKTEQQIELKQEINVTVNPYNIKSLVTKGLELENAQSTTEKYTSEGIVTNILDNSFYVQQDDAAIYVYYPSSKSHDQINIGSKVQITGNLENYRGLIELINPECEVIDENDNLDSIERKVVTTASEVLHEDQSRLAIFKNLKCDASSIQTNSTVEYSFSDGTKFNVRLDKSLSNDIITKLSNNKDKYIDFVDVNIGWFDDAQISLTSADQIVVHSIDTEIENFEKAEPKFALSFTFSEIEGKYCNFRNMSLLFQYEFKFAEENKEKVEETGLVITKESLLEEIKLTGEFTGSEYRKDEKGIHVFNNENKSETYIAALENIPTAKQDGSANAALTQDIYAFAYAKIDGNYYFSQERSSSVEWLLLEYGTTEENDKDINLEEGNTVKLSVLANAAYTDLGF